MSEKQNDNDSAMTFPNEWMIRIAVILAVIIGLAFTLYWEVLSEVSLLLLKRKDASHGYLIPFISAYIVWIDRKKLKELRPGFALPQGAFMIVLGFLLLFLVRDSKDVTLPALSFLVVAIGLFIFFLGKDVFKGLWFPLVFLVTLIPLPREWYFQLGRW